MSSSKQRYEAYLQLRDEGSEALRLGSLEAALESFEEALVLARELGDRDLVDRAICNRCRIALEVSLTDRELRELSEVLLRARDPEIGFLAAYNLVRAHLIRQDAQKAMFYGRIANERARQAERDDFIADARNGYGLALLADSQFHEAEEVFADALGHVDGERSTVRAAILDNLGYCQVVRGEYRSGFRALLESLRILIRGQQPWNEMSTRVSLCFAYLDFGKYRPALRHGRRALGLAEDFGNRSMEKSALFLLGEASKLVGDDFGARRYFDRLQAVYYPDLPFLPEMLMVVDARSMVNLKA
ncbi:MAG: hypothetical protein AAGD01_00385 [Acidobacteriota bacterium]